MASLETRIAELETKIATDEPTPMFVHFVGMGGPEPTTRIMRDSFEWLVQPGETEETFKARVIREDDKPIAKNCVKVYCCY